MRIIAKFKGVAIIMLLTISSILLYQCGSGEDVKSIPRVEKVTDNEVTISWDSRDIYEGVVYYKDASITKRKRPSSAKDEFESIHHKVIVRDLTPSTLYTYWLKNSETRYTFRTAPESSEPFSFLIVSGEPEKDYAPLVRSESCSFMLAVNPVNDSIYVSCNTLVPIFNLNGNGEKIEESATFSDVGRFEWGYLNLVLMNKLTDISKLLSLEGIRYSGIVCNSGVLSGTSDEIRNSAFHQEIVASNKESRNESIAFVGIVDFPGDTFQIDGISYFSIPDGGAVVINIDKQSASAYFPDSDKEIALKMPPLGNSRSCIECRRLANRETYEESLEAYMSFIEDNSNSYKVDDSYFAIAKILDEKLVRLADARKWYKMVLDSFPESDLASTAMERMDFFNEYVGNDYEPMEKFLQIRNEYEKIQNPGSGQGGFVKLTDEQLKLLNKAEGILTKYPDAKMVPQLLLWLAGQYRPDDQMSAVDYYHLLIDKYPEFAKANEVQFYIAETYTDAGMNQTAKTAFLEAKKKLPDLSEKIDSRLVRVNKKIDRNIYLYIAWVVSIIVLLASVLIKPFGFKFPRLKTLLFVSIAFVYGFLMFFAIGMEEIKEEFNSFKEIIIYYIAFILLMVLSMTIVRTYTVKIYKEKMLLAKMVGGIIGTVFFACVFYLIIFYMYEDQLSFINL